MIFSKLFKPKWQHRKPEIRQLEIENLDDPNILHQVARNDGVVSVRQTAVRKIIELNILNEISQQDIDNSVREIAKQRLKQLICCRQKGDCTTLENRLNWMKKSNDTELLAYVAENAPEVSLRLIVIDKISREGLLGDIAVNDTSSEVRLTAVARLTQKSTLERVVKIARNRDKKVSKIAKEKLDAVIEKLERPAKVLAECKAISTKLESLQLRLQAEKYQKSFQDNVNPLKADQTEFQRLQQRWQAIETDVQDEFKANFTNLQTTVATLFENHQHTIVALQEREKNRIPLRTAKQELCDKAEALLIELKNYQHGKDITALEQRFETLKQQWTKAESLDIEAEESNWQERFTRLSQSIQKRQQKSREYHETVVQLQNICGQVNKLINNKFIKAEKVKNLQSNWDKISHPEESLAIFTELKQQFDDSIGILQTHLQKQKKQSHEKNLQLEKLLAELETAVEIGELKTALPLEKKVRQLISEISNLSSTKSKTAEKRLYNCADKIGKLRSWQNWGGEQGREKLCQQLEDLLTRDDELIELMRLVWKAQEDWKKLGSSGYSSDLWTRFDKDCKTIYHRYREHLCSEMEQLDKSSLKPEVIANLVRKAQTDWKQLKGQGNLHELWERFNTACQIAYEPCKVHFDKKSDERQQNLLTRQKLCEQLEKFIGNTNWETPNWKEVRRFCHNIENDWRAVGVTNRKDKKLIQQHFNDSIGLIKSHLQTECQHNYRTRLLLLYQIENLTHELDELVIKHADGNKSAGIIKEKTDAAIDEVKKLQEQWKKATIVPGTNQVEHEFWEVFRGACDAIFNHRKQQQEVTKKQRQSHLEARIALCENVEVLANSDENVQNIPDQLKKLQAQWQQLREEYFAKTDAPKNFKDAIEDRFRKSGQHVLAHYKSHLALERRKQLDLLKQKVGFCVELERDMNQGKADVIQSSWNELPKLNEVELESKMEQRFQAICEAIKTGVVVEMGNNVETKEALCIRMEILAGIESPLDAHGARLAYQVERLSAAINGAETDVISKPQLEVEEIEWDWCSIGAVPSDKTQPLEQRFNRAITAFYAGIT
ncbi:MAG: DUF349 domain-containing protein [Candidatus Marithrix sp.]|nr:DUF349 domain-containing protein [Candidatus Marithrix sp.]